MTQQGKLYILSQHKYNGYDCTDGVVVCAKSPREARQLASTESGVEGVEAWLLSKHSTCKVLKPTAKSKIILIDFNAG